MLSYILVDGESIYHKDEDMYTVLHADDGKEYRKLPGGWVPQANWEYDPKIGYPHPSHCLLWKSVADILKENEPELPQKKPRGRPKKIVTNVPVPPLPPTTMKKVILIKKDVLPVADTGKKKVVIKKS